MPSVSQFNSQERDIVIRKHKLCSNCLRVGHLKQICLSSGCKKCNQKHNTSLHYEKTSFQHLSKTNDAAGKSVIQIRDPRSERGITACVLENSLTITSHIANRDSRGNQESMQDLESATINEKPLTLSFSGMSSSQVLLSTATILFADRMGRWHKCNALLDNGSQSNLMSESLCFRLN